MNCRIDSIKVQDFRGIRRLSLSIKGRNLIVVGENGSGKSSIVDAIEYFFAGRIEPLEGRADVKKRQCIPNLRGGSPKVAVDLRGLSQSVSLSYPRRSAGIPRSLRPFFDQIARQTFVLRRHQVLGFINARDAERYQRISKLVGLGALDGIDKRWRKAHRRTKRQLASLEGEYERTLDRLSDLLDRRIETEKALVRVINHRLADQGLDPIQRQETLHWRLEALRRSTKSPGRTREAESLQELHRAITQTAEALKELQEETAKLRQVFVAFWQKTEVLEDASLEPLLTEGYRVLQANADLSNCPLCEAPIPDYAALLRRLDERVTDLHELTENRRRVRRQRAAVERKLVFVEGLIGELIEGLETHDLKSQVPAAQAALQSARRYRSALDRLEEGIVETERWQKLSSFAQFRQLLPELAVEIVEQRQRLTPSKSEDKQVGLLVTMTRVDEHWQRLREIRRAVRKASFVHQQVDLVYTELVEARKRGLKRLRAELERDFGRFYQQLHPGEGYGSITIPVQRDRRSSVALRTCYHNQAPAHPLNYFSEGHMDSLGLCIFLAFIKRFGEDLKLIVLDDVLTTIDGGHRLRVARLLAREFSGYQFVITTHDRLWAKELDRVLPDSKLVPLKPWSLEHGADCWDHPLSDWAYYEEQARKGRAQDAIGGAGRNLEKFLSRMRLNLALAVPAKRNDAYTIGDLYPIFWKWVNDHPVERLDRPRFVAELEALQSELDEVWALRNWSGAHFNDWAATVTSQEALSFVEAIRRLVAAFECPVCGSLVCYDRNVRALACPSCNPSPPPRVIYRYQTGWHETAAKLLRSGKPRVRKNAASMVQKRLMGFLHDARHRLGLPVLAVPYDEYALEDLYGPFFEWAIAHPRADVNDWEPLLKRSKGTLDAYRRGNQWKDVPNAEIKGFVDAVRQLTSLFECADCGQLLDYDQEEERYFCTACSEQEKISSPLSACWFVKG